MTYFHDDAAPGEALVRAVAWLVPRPQRDDWIEDWAAELRYAWERRGPTLATRLTLWQRAAGALLDALEMRRTHGGDLMLAQDVRFALRRLARQPAFSFVVVLILALGIGTSTAIFTVVDGVLLRPLPYAGVHRLVRLGSVTREHPDFVRPYLSAAEYDLWREQRRVVDRIAVHRGRSFTLEEGEPVDLRGELVSADFFPLLGVAPLLGRTLAPDEIAAGAPVAVVSYELWQTRFGGDPALVGRAITLAGARYTVVGVMPRAFRYPAGTVSVWLPLPPAQQTPSAASATGMQTFAAFGRLAAGVDLGRAKAYAGRLAPAYLPTNGGARTTLRLAALGDRRNDTRVRRGLLVLTGAVACLLLIACANAANLLLIRAAARRDELRLRRALGAGRWRVVRELLAEAALLSTASGAFGVALAYGGVRAILALVPASVIQFNETPIGIDVRVLAFAVGASALTGLAFGLLPALRATAETGRLIASARGASAGVAHNRTRAALVVAELALSVALLAGAGLLGRSFLRLLAVDPGMNTRHVALVDIWLPKERYASSSVRASFFEAALDRVRALPGVTTASVVRGTAGSGDGLSLGVSLQAEGAARPLAEQPRVLPRAGADTGYFRTLGIPLVQGRGFAADELRNDARVAIVDVDLARALWPDGRAVGRRFRVDSTSEWLTVVGVAGDVKLLGADDRDGRFELYYPAATSAGSYGTIAARVACPAASRCDPSRLLPALRAAVHAVDPRLPITKAVTAEEKYREELAQPRFVLVLMATFALVAVTLAGVGLYGVLSYAVAQRTREIGIRMALGARAGRVVGAVLGQGSAIAGAGIAVGLLLSLVAARVISALLFGVAPTDPLTLGAVIVSLAAVALVACWVPARRASRVDPARAIRHE